MREASGITHNNNNGSNHSTPVQAQSPAIEVRVNSPSELDQQHHNIARHQDEHSHHPHDIPSGLDPALMTASTSYPPLSQEEMLGVIENSFNANGHSPFLLNAQSFPSSFSQALASISPDSEHYASPSTVEQFRSNLSSYPEPTFTLGSPTHGQSDISSKKRSATDSPSRTPKRARKAPTASPGGSRATWKTFLNALDAEGRLNDLEPALTRDGGVDPGAVVLWPPDSVSEFVDAVASDVAPGVRIHFRVCLVSDGKRVWDDLVKGN